MKILIIYESRKARTKKLADTIFKLLKNDYLNDVDMFDYKEIDEKNIDYSSYDSTIIGSSLLFGFWPFGLKSFIGRNRKKMKGIALFVSFEKVFEFNENEVIIRKWKARKVKKHIEPLKKKYNFRTIAEGVFVEHLNMLNRQNDENRKMKMIENWVASIIEYFNDYAS